MDLKNFKNFKDFISAPVMEKEEPIKLKLIEEMFNTGYQNQEWIGAILDFLNSNNQNKYFSEYYLRPEGSFGTRKYTYRFISTEEDMPASITDDDIQVLRKFDAQTKFILFDYREDPSLDTFDYLSNKKTLKECLKIIGLTEELKEYLCEFCFNRFKQIIDLKYHDKFVNENLWEPIIPQQSSIEEFSAKPKEKTFNPELWKPLGIDPVDVIDVHITTQHNGFVEYQDPNSRYEVRGIMPSSKNKTLGLSPTIPEKNK